MKRLKEKILRCGRILDGGVLKVDSFLNHQIDPDIMMEIALEFRRRFEHLNPTKILTIEASGIAPAILTGFVMHLPIVFAKKSVPVTMSNTFTSTAHSFTKRCDYQINIAKRYLSPDDRVIFIDDFLAYGNTALAILDICQQAGAKVESMGFVLAKEFQGGADILRSKGIDITILANILSLDNNEVHYV